jgi:putative ABC transport system substrate-binding protein
MAEIRRTEDIALAIEAVQGRVEALYVAGDPLVTTNRTRVAILAVGARLPTIHGNRENVDAGGLISYGPNLPDLHRRVADYVDKILRGTKPADLPVEQPTSRTSGVMLVPDPTQDSAMLERSRREDWRAIAARRNKCHQAAG